LILQAAPQTIGEADMEKAVFAGGCFWCMEDAFAGAPGVVRVTSGYAGGSAETAAYDMVSTGNTQHVEAIEVAYDPARVSYERLLEIFWRSIDPTDAGGQFCDRGRQYAPGVFYDGDAQKRTAEASRDAAEKRLGEKIHAFLRPAVPFYAAEEYHQQFHKKNPAHYQRYKKGSGRMERLAELWGDEEADA
jgi:peptide-methionine (S)-S-oxide reductase